MMDLLPNETLFNILDNVSTQDVLNICQSNQKLKQLCQDDYFWSNRAFNKLKFPTDRFNVRGMNPSIRYQELENLLLSPEKKLLDLLLSQDYEKIKDILPFIDTSKFSDHDLNEAIILSCLCEYKEVMVILSEDKRSINCLSFVLEKMDINLYIVLLYCCLYGYIYSAKMMLNNPGYLDDWNELDQYLSQCMTHLSMCLIAVCINPYYYNDLSKNVTTSINQLITRDPIHYPKRSYVIDHELVNKKYNICLLLLQKGADPNFRDHKCVTTCIKYQYTTIIKFLLDYIDINILKPEIVGEVIIYFSKFNEIYFIKNILEKKDISSRYLNLALIYSCAYGYLDLVNYLLHKSNDIDPSYNHNEPLYISSKLKHYDIVMRLLSDKRIRLQSDIYELINIFKENQWYTLIKFLESSYK